MKSNCIAVQKSTGAGKVGQFFKNVSPFNTRDEMPKIQFIIKKLLGYLLANLGSMVLGTAVIVLMHYPLGLDPLKGEAFGGYAGQLFTALNYLLPCLLVLLYWRLFEKKKLSEMFVKKGVGCYLIGLLIGAVLAAACIASVVLTGTVRVNGLTAHPDILSILLSGLMFIFQSAHEELLCRGVAFSSLKNKLGTPAAFAVSTAFFMVPHISSMQSSGTAVEAVGMLNNLLISAIFLLVMLLTDSILASCGLHFIWNFALANIFGLTVSGVESLEYTSVINAESVGRNVVNGSSFGIEGSIVTTFFYAVCAAVLFVILRRRSSAETERKC